MNAITLIWRQVLKELKLFQMKENKEDAVEKTDKEPQKTLKCHEDKYTVLHINVIAFIIFSIF